MGGRTVLFLCPEMKGFLGFSLEVALIPLREEGLDKGFADADRSTFQLENNMNNSGDNQEQ